MILHVAFGAGHKERVGDMKCMQSAKNDIASIHYIDGSGLRCDQNQRQRIAHFTVGNVDKAGDGTTQIEQCMHFDGSFGATKISPRKQSETQIYRSAVECIDCVVVIAHPVFSRGLSSRVNRTAWRAPMVRRLAVSRTDRMLA